MDGHMAFYQPLTPPLSPKEDLASFLDLIQADDIFNMVGQKTIMGNIDLLERLRSKTAAVLPGSPQLESAQGHERLVPLIIEDETWKVLAQRARTLGHDQGTPLYKTVRKQYRLVNQKKNRLTKALAIGYKSKPGGGVKGAPRGTTRAAMNATLAAASSSTGAPAESATRRQHKVAMRKSTAAMPASSSAHPTRLGSDGWDMSQSGPANSQWQYESSSATSLSASPQFQDSPEVPLFSSLPTEDYSVDLYAWPLDSFSLGTGFQQQFLDEAAAFSLFDNSLALAPAQLPAPTPPMTGYTPVTSLNTTPETWAPSQGDISVPVGFDGNHASIYVQPYGTMASTDMFVDSRLASLQAQGGI